MLLKPDEHGRIILPEAYLRALGIEENGEVEIGLFSNEIILRKPNLGCVFCNSAAHLVRAEGLFVCRTCINSLNEARDGGSIYVMKID